MHQRKQKAASLSEVRLWDLSKAESLCTRLINYSEWFESNGFWVLINHNLTIFAKVINEKNTDLPTHTTAHNCKKPQLTFKSVGEP